MRYKTYTSLFPDTPVNTWICAATGSKVYAVTSAAAAQEILSNSTEVPRAIIQMFDNVAGGSALFLEDWRGGKLQYENFAEFKTLQDNCMKKTPPLQIGTRCLYFCTINLLSFFQQVFFPKIRT